MYSPKISEDLIPRIYQLAMAERVKMTTLVNRILEKALNGKEAEEWTQENTSVSSQETNTGNISPYARQNNAPTFGPMHHAERLAVSSLKPISSKEEDEREFNKNGKEDDHEAARIGR